MSPIAFDNVISRTDAAALVPEDVSNELLGALTNQAAALTLFPQVRMSTKTTRMPVLSALPTAYFVDGDTGLKQTSEVGWANKYITAEEIAVILPIPEAVLDDTAFDIWGNAMPLAVDAFSRVLDAAVFFGTNKPSTWPEAVVPSAVAAGNVIARGKNNAASGGIAGDFSDLFATVEADGFDVNGIIANTSYKGRIRQARGTDGQPLQDLNGNLFGVAPTYPMRGLWPTGVNAAEAIAGDFSQGILGIRQDITYKLLDQAVIQDNTGAIVYNLAQQDMVALRMVMRVGFQVKNTLNYDQPLEAQRYPWAVLRSPAA